MSKIDAQVSTTYEFRGTARGADGYTIEWLMDDSFKSWRAIVRWNLHYRHKRALAVNARDLFTKVLWRKLWRRS